MRRTTLAASSPSSWPSRFRRRPSAQRLRRHVAHQRLPGAQQGADLQLRRLDTLQLQIERGAPADVFASASPTEAQTLFKEGLCTRPVTFAINRLVLLVPDSNPGDLTLVYSLRPGGRELAIGAAGVPIGTYTRVVLGRSAFVGPRREHREPGVRRASVATKVALGSADAGFVYLTDAMTVRAGRRLQTAQARPAAGALPGLRRSVATRANSTAGEASSARCWLRRGPAKAGRFGFGPTARCPSRPAAGRSPPP